ncbi:Uncharacterized protein TCM_022062 isoform 2, partial [Theobroma cacao]
GQAKALSSPRPMVSRPTNDRRIGSGVEPHLYGSTRALLNIEEFRSYHN